MSEIRTEADGRRFRVNKNGRKTEICEHDKTKYRCKACNPHLVCEHDVLKKNCSKCGGKNMCSCGKRISRCRVHGGQALCPCGKEKNMCQTHGGNSLCPCNIRRNHCKKHGGSVFCSCGKYKYHCKKHNGSSLCSCGKLKNLCKEHGGTSYCPCGLRISYCHIHYKCPCGVLNTECNVMHKNNFCTVCKVFLLSLPRRQRENLEERLCEGCEVRNYGQNLMRIEIQFLEKFKSWGFFPSVHDKTIRDSSCKIIKEHNSDKLNRKRIEFYFQTLRTFPYDVLVECDENCHNGYDITCEYGRLEDLCDQLTANRGFIKPLVIIRFNPFSKLKDLDAQLKRLMERAFAGEFKVDDDRGFEVVALLGYSEKRLQKYEENDVTKRQKI